MNAIETRCLTRSFGALVAVNNVDLIVPRGAIYALLGRNGAGKSTTIKLLLGLLSPHGGEVHLFDTPFPEKQSRQNRDLLSRIGALIETPSFYPHLTGRQNLAITATLRGSPNHEVRRVLEATGLERDADRPAGTYSRGMQQRLGLAQALLDRPHLLILDEPLSSLDPHGMNDIRDLMRSLSTQHGTTLLLATHLLSEVESTATHIGVLRDGRLVYQGTPSALRAMHPSRVVLSVDEADTAARCLQNQGWAVTRCGTTLVAQRDQCHVEDLPIVNGVLTDAGVRVFQIGIEPVSLEHVFLTITR